MNSDFKNTIKSLLGVTLIVTTLLGFWAIEMTLVSGPYTFECEMFGQVTNALFSFSGCLTYHLWMTAIIVLSIGAGIVLIQD